MITMKTRVVAFTVLFAVGCGGAVDDAGGQVPSNWSCSDGALVVEGPAAAIMARYPSASPPERLLAHATSPGMFVTVEYGGWTRFAPYEPVPAGGVARITTTDYGPGEPLCPVDVVIEGEP